MQENQIAEQIEKAGEKFLNSLRKSVKNSKRDIHHFEDLLQGFIRFKNATVGMYYGIDHHDHTISIGVIEDEIDIQDLSRFAPRIVNGSVVYQSSSSFENYSAEELAELLIKRLNDVSRKSAYVIIVSASKPEPGQIKIILANECKGKTWYLIECTQHSARALRRSGICRFEAPAGLYRDPEGKSMLLCENGGKILKRFDKKDTVDLPIYDHKHMPSQELDE